MHATLDHPVPPGRADLRVDGPRPHPAGEVERPSGRSAPRESRTAIREVSPRSLRPAQGEAGRTPIAVPTSLLVRIAARALNLPSGVRARAIPTQVRTARGDRVINVACIGAPLVSVGMARSGGRSSLEIEPIPSGASLRLSPSVVVKRWTTTPFWFRMGGARAGHCCAFDVPAIYVPGKVLERLQVVRLRARLARTTEGQEGETIDLHLDSSCPGKVRVPAAPRVADDERHRGLRQLQCGVGLRILANTEDDMARMVRSPPRESTTAHVEPPRIRHCTVGAIRSPGESEAQDRPCRSASPRNHHGDRPPVLISRSSVTSSVVAPGPDCNAARNHCHRT